MTKITKIFTNQLCHYQFKLMEVFGSISSIVDIIWLSPTLLNTPKLIYYNMVYWY